MTASVPPLSAYFRLAPNSSTHCSSRWTSTELLADRLVPVSWKLSVQRVVFTSAARREASALDTLSQRRQPSTGDTEMTASCSSGLCQHLWQGSSPVLRLHVLRIAKYCEANEPNKARGAGLRGTACDQTQKQQWDKLNSPTQESPCDMAASSSEPDGTEHKAFQQRAESCQVWPPIQSFPRAQVTCCRRCFRKAVCSADNPSCLRTAHTTRSK